jgi:hypothetical protein
VINLQMRLLGDVGWSNSSNAPANPTHVARYVGTRTEHVGILSIHCITDNLMPIDILQLEAVLTPKMQKNTANSEFEDLPCFCYGGGRCARPIAGLVQRARVPNNHT